MVGTAAIVGGGGGGAADAVIIFGALLAVPALAMDPGNPIELLRLPAAAIRADRHVWRQGTRLSAAPCRPARFFAPICDQRIDSVSHAVYRTTMHWRMALAAHRPQEVQHFGCFSIGNARYRKSRAQPTAFLPGLLPLTAPCRQYMPRPKHDVSRTGARQPHAVIPHPRQQMPRQIDPITQVTARATRRSHYRRIARRLAGNRTGTAATYYQSITPVHCAAWSH